MFIHSFPESIQKKIPGHSIKQQLLPSNPIQFISSCTWLKYTGCPRRNVRDFGSVPYVKLYCITQNTYIQSWTVTEIMAREVWNFDSCYSLIDYQIHIETGRNMWFLLISVLNIKVTCEWHKAIKLNYKNARTTVIFVLRLPSTLNRPQLTVILWRQSYCAVKHSPRSLDYDVSLPGMRIGRVWRHGRRTVRGNPRSPHFSMAIISVTIKLWI